MANPEVMKRLEEIEARLEQSADCSVEDYEELSWLLRLTRALLESQGELMETVRGFFGTCKDYKRCCGNQYCGEVFRAEKVRKGEV